VTISGSSFGTKNPAAPLWWDDGEGASINTPGVMTSGELNWVVSGWLSGSNKRYRSAEPSGTSDTSTRMQYRQIPRRNVEAPHSRSTKYLTGCHDDEGECMGGEVGQNVGLTVSAGNRYNKWFASYYLRLDPLWPIGSSSNYKFFNWEMGSPFTMYSSPFCYDNVNGCGGCDGFRKAPDCNEDYWGSPHVIQILNINTCPITTSPTCGSPVITKDSRKNNPRRQWIKQEHILDYSGDYYIIKVDNADLLNSRNYSGCSLNKSSYPNAPGGVTIGGFWKQGVCGNNQDDLNDNACRYFDDVYVDNTFARVVLADNSNYQLATIIEPQIPSTWASGQITVSINLGRFPSNSTAYLFVFDSNNDHNSTGYPVMIGGGGGGDPLPAPPTGLRIQ
jgi:hypothetical protein